VNSTTLALVSAAGGWLLAIFLAVTSYLERRSQRRQDLLLSALGYLTGGSQKRSIGLAIIEGLWSSHNRFRKSLIPALTNQAVYLLLESSQGDARHEFHNWLRIMRLILSSKWEEEFFEFYSELADALFRRAQKVDEDEEGVLSPERGIMIGPTVAGIWLEKLKTFARIDIF